MNAADLFRKQIEDDQKRKSSNLKEYLEFQQNWQKTHPIYKFKDYWTVIPTLILLLAIPITVYITSQARDFRSKAAVPNQQDLDVTFIERTPRYNRFNVTYPNSYPRLYPGTELEKRDPVVGQEVTFIAHYKNAGGVLSDNFNYKWFIDGVEVDSGTQSALAPGSVGSQTLNWNWETGDHDVKFQVDSSNQLTEISEDNNQLTERINAIYLRVHVEQTTYDNFNRLLNLVGSYSFEDWVQAQMVKLNEKLADSGSLSRVRIDQITLQADGSLPRGGKHSPVNWEWDGSWGFSWDQDTWCMPGFCNTSGNYNDITYWVTKIQPGLLHEWTHQMGMAHSYDANVTNSNNLITNQNLLQLNPDVVGIGGDDVGVAFDQNRLLTPYYVSALDSTYGKRRGYYADYLFAIPDTNKLLIKDVSNNPIPNALLKIWQSRSAQVTGAPKFVGTTDSNGEYVLPNVPLTEGSLTTETGHIQKPNPFGVIDVNARNGMFLVEINWGNQKSYKNLSIHEFNLAFFRGFQNSATYTLSSGLATGSNLTDNLALNKTATSFCNNSCDQGASGAMDGDKTSTSSGYWEPSGSTASNGNWWKVDLGSSYNLTRITVYSSARNNIDMFDKFDLEVSNTGSFSGEQILVASETGWNSSRNNGQTVVYNFNPTMGRYVRLVVRVDNWRWARLQEFEVFAASPGSPLEVGLTAPADGSQVSTTLNAAANATGNSISKVGFYLDGILLNEDTIAPYTIAADITDKSEGVHYLYAQATSATGQIAFSPVGTIVVHNDTINPLVTLTSPVNGENVSNNFTLAATATDNKTLAKVEFLINNTVVGVDSSSPYSLAYNSNLLTDGNHTIQAKAYDTWGNTALSAISNITIANRRGYKIGGESQFYNWNYEVEGGSNRILVVGIGIRSASSQVNLVTANNKKLVQIGARSQDSIRVELWRLLNPDEGTNNIEVRLSTEPSGSVAGAASFTNIDQTNPTGPFISQTAFSSNPAITVPAAVGETVVDILALPNLSNDVINQTVGQTLNWKGWSTGEVGVGSSTKPGATSVNMSWSTKNEFWVLGAVSIKQIPPPPVPSVDLKINETNGPVTINYQQAVSLSWSSTNSTSCTLSPSNLNDLNNTGVSSGALTTTTTFTVSCLGNGGSTSDSVEVIVNPPVVSAASLGNNNQLGSKTYKTGDLNKDDKINIYDLSILLSRWRQGSGAGDINTDSRVDIYDLSILLSNWGK